MKNDKTVDAYLEKYPDRKQELARLRKILLAAGLQETVKWGMPTYTLEGKNLVGIGAFKHWSCLWFHNGSLLKDPGGVLVNAQEGKTKALRQWRFYSTDDIDEIMVKAYIKEAIANHRAGKNVNTVSAPTETKIEFEVPALLQMSLEKHPKLMKMFNGLTLKQQRDYAEYVAEPKRETTQKARLERILPLIDEGRPLADLWTKK